MTPSAAPVVRKKVVVDVPVERAFALFTDGFGDFKPPEHNLLAVPIATTVFEPWVGGHIIDRGTDGSSAGGNESSPTTSRAGSCSAGTSGRPSRSRPTRRRPVRSMSSSRR